MRDGFALLSATRRDGSNMHWYAMNHMGKRVEKGASAIFDPADLQGKEGPYLIDGDAGVKDEVVIAHQMRSRVMDGLAILIAGSHRH